VVAYLTAKRIDPGGQNRPQQRFAIPRDRKVSTALAPIEIDHRCSVGKAVTIPGGW
jgi:hypothetical protein